jgi:hypothetical protein
VRAWAVIAGYRLTDPPPIPGTSTLTALEVAPGEGRDVEDVLGAVLEDELLAEDADLIPVDAAALARVVGGTVRHASRAWVRASQVVGLIVSDAGPEDREVARADAEAPAPEGVPA